MDLEVAVQRRLAGAARLPARGIEAPRQVGDGFVEALGDGGEVLLVAAR